MALFVPYFVPCFSNYFTNYLFHGSVFFIVGDIRLVVVCEEGGWRRIVRECSVRCGGPRSLSESSGVRSTTRTAFFRYPGKSKERTTERRATPPNVRVESVRTEELVS